MRLSKRLENAVIFAHWCQNNSLTPTDGAELITLAKRAHSAGVRGCNVPCGPEREERAGQRFEDKAHELGFMVDWPGLWPVLRKNGRDIMLPDVG
jgi:hypothetical protein